MAKLIHGFFRKRDDPGETPARPRQHELEEASRRALESLLPDRLVFRRLDGDYGIDGEVEEFKDGRATGLRFFVQLKATDEPNLRTALRARVKHSTAAYFRAQPVPVLMIRYVAEEDSLYGRWFHQFDPYYEHAGERELTFHWEADSQLTEEGVHRLLDEVAAVMEAKSTKQDLPVRIGLTVPSGGAFGLSRAELELGVRAAASRCPDLIEIVGDDEEHLLSLVIAVDELAAHVPGLGSLTMHVEEDWLDAADDIAKAGTELLSCMAVALARAGHADLASRLAMHFFAESFLGHLAPFYFEIAEAMAYAARATEALELAEKLDQRDGEDAKSASFAFLLSALRRGAHLHEVEQSRLVDTMKARMHRREKEGDASGAATESVGLGNYFRATASFSEAVRAYERAVELDPAYESREHLWLELGGVYCLSGQYQEAADAYGRALELSEEPMLEVEACQADALMHAGRYREAYEIFEPIAGDATHVGAWAAMKAAALWWVMQTTGVEEQDRDVGHAERIAGQFADGQLLRAEVSEVSKEIWDADAVSPLGWFNLARDYLDNRQEECAMYAYLVTAVMQEGDVEAWVNVANLGISLGQENLAAAAIVTGARLNNENYMLELARVARANLSDPQERENFLEAVNAMLEEVLPDKVEPGFELRFVSEGKPVESIHLPPPGRRP